MNFTRAAAALWIEEHQLRRNLTDDQRAVIANRVRKRRAAIAMKERATRANDVKYKNPSLEENVSPKERTRTAVAKEARVSEWKRRLAAELVEEHPELEAKVLAREMSLADAKRQVRKAEINQKLNSVEALEAKELAGQYDVVVIDPPWPMEKIERDVSPNQVKFDYPTMSIEQIRAESGEILLKRLAKDAHVFLWTTHKFLPDALTLVDEWGLKYVCLFTWHKPGGFQPFGLPQYNSEFAIYARKGTPAFVDTKQFPVCFNAPRGAHSEKPEEFYEMLRRTTGGRRLDMFNRRLIEGLDGWGKEAEDLQ